MILNSLKSKLAKWQRTIADQGSASRVPIITRSLSAQKQTSSSCPFRKHEREKVAGGDIIWKPVNKIAAFMLAKAPWWAHPPQVNKGNNEKKKTQIPQLVKRDIKKSPIKKTKIVPGGCGKNHRISASRRLKMTNEEKSKALIDLWNGAISAEDAYKILKPHK